MGIFDFLFGKKSKNTDQEQKPQVVLVPKPAVKPGSTPSHSALPRPDSKPSLPEPGSNTKSTSHLSSKAASTPLLNSHANSSPIPAKARSISVDWRNSMAHLQLLSRFLYARDALDAAPPYWDDVLGEPVAKAIEHMISDGLLLPAGLADKLDWAFKLVDLKPLLKERSLPVSGKKRVLIDRLVECDPEGMEQKVIGLRILECSPAARLIAEKYQADHKAEKEAAQSSSKSLLEAADFLGASLAVSHYEAKQVFKRGMGMNWENHDAAADAQFLSLVFQARPKILDGLSDDDWALLRVAAAMMHLWGTGSAMEWLPENFGGVDRFDHNTAARMLVFHVRNLETLRQYREIGIKNAQVKGCGNDSCPACRKLADKILPLDELPELPHAGCTNEIGCRCYLAGEFDFS